MKKTIIAIAAFTLTLSVNAQTETRGNSNAKNVKGTQMSAEKKLKKRLRKQKR